ncbi:MAG: hypothetical protein ACD_37C00027G0007 [uncultured bacterium]|nr:MAG: hypothetical protein ACD_37C00027G0007 [uncultured bacterium]KKP95254.1 MAG: 30S ribosomal protein S16 [Candidatus Levybacteria bacterium GW2011_GWA2_36_13]KKQ00533.1 MAG: 30S ribosomal protein S16 [Candidatus Levybacteria bacterium GW2011_GWB1_36_18]KKQ58014.1 MAG: ribosomal protein S16, small subunit ribosomal protein S16 [Microgenomates group bacterium GW2011_GWC1_38_14]KKR16299.1 MAG: 30S ribosomal protein S16 [Candidatus Levybacteria bacterium GW2011_GWA1_39_32]OGH10206.1 MAG: 30S
MSVVIRLSRVGKKGERRFRIVVSEKRERRDGRPIEFLGYFDKGAKKSFNKNDKRYEYWISKGAQPSPTVEAIFSK